MKSKTFKVYFTRTFVGVDGDPIDGKLSDAVDAHGPHLPALDLSNERFQIRDLELVGAVWKGTFVKLRDDAPHVVAADDREHELRLEQGDHIIEKCHFLYRKRGNLLIWQKNVASGGLTRVAEYLSRFFGEVVTLPLVMNDEDFNRVLEGHVYELDFAFDRLRRGNAGAPVWNQPEFETMNRVDAAHAKFTFRAARRGWLADGVKNLIRSLVGEPGIKKVRVKMTDESEPIDMFLAPLKDAITVQLLGRYPIAAEVFAELEQAFDRQRDNIPGVPIR